MKLTIAKTTLLACALGGCALAQLAPDGLAQAAPPPPAAPAPAATPAPPLPPRPPEPPRAPGRGMMMPGPAGKWWDNPELAKQLNLTADQQKRMDEVFQQHRLRLIDLHAAVEKEEAVLDPLINAANPDDSRVLPQIDRVAQARAELEKANARLLLGLRHVLTPEQWKMLQDEPHRQIAGPAGRGGPGGPPAPPHVAPPPPPRPDQD